MPDLSSVQLECVKHVHTLARQKSCAVTTDDYGNKRRFTSPDGTVEGVLTLNRGTLLVKVNDVLVLIKLDYGVPWLVDYVKVAVSDEVTGDLYKFADWLVEH